MWGCRATQREYMIYRHLFSSDLSIFLYIFRTLKGKDHIGKRPEAQWSFDKESDSYINLTHWRSFLIFSWSNIHGLGIPFLSTTVSATLHFLPHHVRQDYLSRWINKFLQWIFELTRTEDKTICILPSPEQTWFYSGVNRSAGVYSWQRQIPVEKLMIS